MIEDKIKDLIIEDVNSGGYKLLKVNVQSLEKKKIVQIFAERSNYESVDIEDCRTISKMVAAIFEENNTINGAYDLEVSSPGLERPLVDSEDFIRFKSFLISVKTKFAIEGVRKFRGRIKEILNEKLILVGDNGEASLEVELVDIDSAKIVVTDELLKSKGEYN